MSMKELSVHQYMDFSNQDAVASIRSILFSAQFPYSYPPAVCVCVRAGGGMGGCLINTAAGVTISSLPGCSERCPSSLKARLRQMVMLTDWEKLLFGLAFLPAGAGRCFGDLSVRACVHNLLGGLCWERWTLTLCFKNHDGQKTKTKNHFFLLLHL